MKSPKGSSKFIKIIIGTLTAKAKFEARVNVFISANDLKVTNIETKISFQHSEIVSIITYERNKPI